MLTLFEHPLSPYAQKVKIALYEKGIPFEAKIPNLFGDPEPEFLGSSPRREVPSLIDGDFTVFDSTVILEYVEDRWPDPALRPSSARDRARVRMIEDQCDTYFEAINWGLAEIAVFGRATGDLASSMTARAAQQIAGVHRWLERELGDRPWFNGDAFGWGDLSVWPYVAGSAGFGHAPPAGSRLAAWFGRASERDSTRKCTEAVAQVMASFQNLGPLVESGAFIREYRDHRLEWTIRTGGLQIVVDGLAKKNIRMAHEIA
ncbi:MAG TPA: glutathione S-transferase family protein [Candidatus Binatia bacterium]|nr:glutathione S-transferase family protein [Candidatus Binatia bacterium]